jgi:hypothetical protein
MRIPRFLDSLPVQLAILRSAAWLVPGSQRAEWFAEWRSELWYVRQARHRDDRPWSPRVATAFCLGAFHDALWLRWNSPSGPASGFFRLESPVQCLLFLAVLAVVSLFFALRVPVARDLLLPSPYRDAPELVMISAHRHRVLRAPTIPIDRYQAWTNGARSRFTGLAFYQPILSQVRISPREAAELSIAQASDNLFELLNLTVSSALPNPGTRENRAALILSRHAWRKYFAGDAHIVGRVFDIAGQRAVVSGVLEENSWRLPGQIDAWLLENQRGLARLPSHSRGFVLAHIRTSASHSRPKGLWHVSLPNEEGGYSDFDCAPLAERIQDPFGAFFMMVVITWLVMRTTPVLSLGASGANRDRWTNRLRLWTFFLTKVALLLPIVIFGALDLAYLIASIVPVHLEGLALPAAWGLAVRWVMRDQKERCPVCLRLLINPVEIGQASQTFLGWYGTELMCAKGHGLLHVAELPTSSSSATRWIQLDPSWSGLF